MFGIGAVEFLLIAVVALLVIGPQQMPRALYLLGRGLGKLRRFSNDIQTGLDKFTEEAALEDIAREANQAGDALTEFRIEQQKALEIRDAPQKKKAPAKKSQAKKASTKKKAVKKTAVKKSAAKKTSPKKKKAAT
jgi:sec-independent protein translocase protein TatB